MRAYKSGFWVNGPYVKKLTERFKKYVNCKYAVPTSSGTAALHQSLDILDLKSGDEIITTTFTFPATGNVIEHIGARPVFVDIEKDTYNIDPDLIGKAVTAKTRAIMPVHIAGHPCDMEKIIGLAGKYGLFIIEDAAHAIESFSEGQRTGKTGDLVCFSFDVTKNVAGGLGGMIAAKNKKIEDSLRIRSHFGIIPSDFSEPSDTVYPGYKNDMCEFCAAIAVNQLDRVEENLNIREKYWKIYDSYLDGVKEITIPAVRPGSRHSRHLYLILLNLRHLACSRKTFMESLRSKNVGSRIRFSCLHLNRFYREKYDYSAGDMPVAEDISSRVISIPFSPALTVEEIEYIAVSVLKTVKEYRK